MNDRAEFPVRWRWQAPAGTTARHAAGVGDLDGDGFAEVAVALRADGRDAGVAVFRGGPAGPGDRPDCVIPPPQADADFGAALAAAGDFDGDGRPDLLVGAPHAANAAGVRVGQAYLFCWPAGAARPELRWQAEGPHADAEFGAALAGTADLDANVWPEAIIGAPMHGAAAGGGGVWIFKGPGPALQSQGQWWLSLWPKPGAGCGQALAALDNFNGDRWGDFALAALGGSDARERGGFVNVYAGAELVLSDRPCAVFIGHAAHGRFGAVLVPIGDFDGDGLTDLAVGSPDLNDAVPGAGRVDVILGLPLAKDAGHRWITREPSPASPLGAALGAPWLRRWGPPAAAGGGLLLAAAGVWSAFRRHARRAVDRERLRVARDLHDRVGSLAQLILHQPGGRGDAGIRSLSAEVDAVVWSTHPGRASLEETATYLVDRVAAALQGTPVRLELDIPLHLPAANLSPESRSHLESAAREILANTLRHAAADELRVRLRAAAGVVEIEFADNGRGFDPAAVPRSCDGLANLRARMAGLGGGLELESRPGHGTRLRLRIPLEPA